MARREDESVPIGPQGIGRVEPQVVLPELDGQWGEGHDGPGVTRVGPVDRIDREGANRVGREFLEPQRFLDGLLRHAGIVRKGTEGSDPGSRKEGESRAVAQVTGELEAARSALSTTPSGSPTPSKTSSFTDSDAVSKTTSPITSRRWVADWATPMA